MAEDNNFVLRMERETLREHIGLPRKPNDPKPPKPETQPVFFIELTSPSTRGGAHCKLLICNQGLIRPGEYRLALTPSMDMFNFMAHTPGIAGMAKTAPCYDL